MEKPEEQGEYSRVSASQQPGYAGWLVMLGILTAIGPLSIDMYLPSFPMIERDLAAPSGSIELSLATFFIGLAMGQLVYGPLSDRFGRKPLLYVGFTLYTLASLGCALATSVSWLYVSRFVQGVGGCAGIMIPRAMVRDRTTPQEMARAFSMLLLVMGVAPILAPLFGGWMLVLGGWRAIFGILTGYGALCLVIAFWRLNETRDTTHAAPLRMGDVLRTYGRLLIDREFIGLGSPSRAGSRWLACLRISLVHRLS